MNNLATNKIRKPKKANTVATTKSLHENRFVVIVAILLTLAMVLTTVVGFFTGTMDWLLGSTPAPGTANQQQAANGKTSNAELIKIYQDFLKKDPNNMRVTEELATAYFGLAMENNGKDKVKADQNFKLAMAEYDKVLAKNPKNYAALGDLATAQFYSGDAEKAVATARKALEIKPDFAPARMNLGIYLAGQNKYTEAIAELKKVPATSAQSSSAKDLIKQYEAAMVKSKSKTPTPAPTQQKTAPTQKK